jgi:hypothetical protein
LQGKCHLLGRRFSLINPNISIIYTGAMARMLAGPTDANSGCAAIRRETYPKQIRGGKSLEGFKLTPSSEGDYFTPVE